MGRVLAVVVLGGVWLVLALATWPQLFDLQRTMLFAQLAAMRGLVVLVALAVAVLFVLFALMRRGDRRITGGFAVALLVIVAVDLAVLSVRGTGQPEAAPPAPDELTVLTWNTLGDAPGAERIAELALDEGADIVALPETSDRTARDIATRMAGGGSPMQVLVLQYDEVAKARSTALLISEDLGGYTFDRETRTTPRLPTVIATPVDGEGPTIVAGHPVAPTPFYLADWRRGLEVLADVCRGDDVILAGDLNATLDHFEGLGDGGSGRLGGCSDGAKAVGSAAVGTWPAQLPALLAAPIDHVMATDGWEFTAFRVIETLDEAGSDHRPVLARLRAVS
jgi:endonuclease/exonuclease/phosphatase (EEP) superfamily protein YafD